MSIHCPLTLRETVAELLINIKSDAGIQGDRAGKKQ